MYTHVCVCMLVILYPGLGSPHQHVYAYIGQVNKQGVSDSIKLKKKREWKLKENRSVYNTL